MTYYFEDYMAATQPVAVKLDPETRARLKTLATVRDRSAHWLMREAIAQYVEREESRESFRQDALRAWEGYQSDGLHVTAEEADAWLARLEAGEEVEPPKAHR
jgi:predicted transcriptional regulator